MPQTVLIPWGFIISVAEEQEVVSSLSLLMLQSVTFLLYIRPAVSGKALLFVDNCVTLPPCFVQS